MNSSAMRRLEMFVRVREYGATRAAVYPPASRGGELLAEVNNVLTGLEAQTAAQSSGKRAGKEKTTLKSVARAALREELEAISRTARALALTVPGLDDKFRLPRNVGDQVWLATARSFAADAQPLKAEFIRRGLPAEFLADLDAAIAEFEQAIDQRAHSTGARVAATAAIDELIERGMNAVRELDAIVRNTARHDPAALAEWLSASHVERAAQHAVNKPAQPAQAVTPTQPRQ